MSASAHMLELLSLCHAMWQQAAWWVLCACEKLFRAFTWLLLLLLLSQLSVETLVAMI